MTTDRERRRPLPEGIHRGDDRTERGDRRLRVIVHIRRIRPKVSKNQESFSSTGLETQGVYPEDSQGGRRT